MDFLYRYRPAKDYELDALSRAEVFFTSVDRFNDPNEFAKGRLEPIKNHLVDELSKITGTSVATYKECFAQSTFELEQQIKDGFCARHRICCFTNTYSNTEMWKNYAQENGFCVEYKAASLQEDATIGYHKVNYTDCDITMDGETADAQFAQFLKILTSKNSSFQEEDEIRAITSANTEEIELQEYFDNCKDHDYWYWFKPAPLGCTDPPKYFKSHKNRFVKIQPNAIIVSQYTPSQFANSLKEIAKQLNCQYREFKI